MPCNIPKYFFLTLITFASLVSIQSKPIIGIYTNPTTRDATDITEAYISPSYVKWLEAAGAEIIPIHSWYSDSELDNVLSKVNGVLFQGGSNLLRIDSPFVITATKIFNRVIKEKDESNKVLPIWGTCQGFELFHVIVSGSRSILDNFSAWNLPTNLQINSDANKTSKIYSLFSDQDIINLIAEPLTAEFHHLGIGLKEYNLFPDVENFFDKTSFAFDNDNKLYVSSIEAKDYPIYAVQYHPEKTSYDKIYTDNIPQGIDAVRITQNLANYFVNTARSNTNSMTEDEKKKFGLINIYQMTTEKNDNYDVYIFKKPTVQINAIKFLS